MRNSRDVFTDRHIRSLSPTSDGPPERFDEKVRGLGIRVHRGGTKSFFVFYRIGGLSRRLTLGRYGAVSLKEARSLARDALSQVRRGIDPAAERKRARDDYKGRLFPAVLDDFIENYAQRNTRSWKETERILRREFEKLWRRLRIEQITKQHVSEVLNSIAKRGAPSSANHALSHLKRLFSWGVETGHLEVSPCAGLKKPCKVVSRDRVLSADELAAIWLASEKMAWPFGPVVQLLMLTGQRRSEVSSLCWHDLNLQHRIWTQPAEGNKSARVHLVPLSPFAMQVIQPLPRVNDVYVFPARGRNTPLSGYSKWKRKLDEVSGVTDWTLHDLRRTTATGMAALGVSPHVIEAVLNHRSGVLGGIAGTYNRFEFLDERRYALELWAQHVQAIISRSRGPIENQRLTADRKEATRLTAHVE